MDISGLRLPSQAKQVLLIHSFLVALHHVSWLLAGTDFCCVSPQLPHTVLLELVLTRLSVGVLSILNVIQLPLGFGFSTAHIESGLDLSNSKLDRHVKFNSFKKLSNSWLSSK